MVAAESLDLVSGKTRARKPASEGVLIRRAVKCVGITPLLQNRLTEEDLLKLWTKAKAPKSASRPSPEEAASTKVHVNASGQPIMPVQNFLSCLIEAGKFVRLDGKRQMSTAKSTLLPSVVTIEEHELLLTNSQGTPATWRVDMRQGRNPNGGEAVAVVRPLFDDWGFVVTLQIDTSQIGEAVIRELVDLGARRVGVGDFRPQRKGIFGQFRVDSWVRAEEEH